VCAAARSHATAEGTIRKIWRPLTSVSADPAAMTNPSRLVLHAWDGKIASLAPNFTKTSDTCHAACARPLAATQTTTRSEAAPPIPLLHSLRHAWPRMRPRHHVSHVEWKFARFLAPLFPFYFLSVHDSRAPLFLDPSRADHCDFADPSLPRAQHVCASLWLTRGPFLTSARVEAVPVDSKSCVSLPSHHLCLTRTLSLSHVFSRVLSTLLHALAWAQFKGNLM
jgi:hypothetical protein